MKPLATFLAFALGAGASAHRVDEYLQATILSLGKEKIGVSMLLMPGVAVFPQAMAAFDLDKNGSISAAEQKAYAAKVLRDLTLSVDGKTLIPRLKSIKFPKVDLMKKGLGTIELKFDVAVPAGSGTRNLEFENRHLPKIAAYMVNCLEPSDPSLKVTDQKRNYTQSLFEMVYG